MAAKTNSSPVPESEHVSRFSVSLPPRLLKQLDRMVDERGMPSRSAAIAEMINAQLVDHYEQVGRQVMAGTITVVYRTDQQDLRSRLTGIQRKYLKEIIASQHVFLEAEHHLEVLLVQGPAPTLHALRAAIMACKGVRTAELTLTAALLPPLH